MRKHLTALLAAGVLLLGGSSAFAHHSFAAEYDGERPAHLEGKVLKVDWGNPHSYLTIKGRADNGKEERFKVELGSRAALERNGWARRTIRVGDYVSVDGWYGRRDHERINAHNVRINNSGHEFDAASSFYSTAPAGN